MTTHDNDIGLPPLVGTLAGLPERHREVIEAYGQACARVAVEADRQRRGEPSDSEIRALAKKHIFAHAQFVGAGEVWYEGEVEFARALLARYGHPTP